MDINPEDETSYTSQYQEALLTYVQNEYCAINQLVPDNRPESLPSCNLVRSVTASRSCQSSFDPYDSSSDDEGYLMPTDVAEMTPGQSVHGACILTAARLYLNLPPEAPKIWGQINPSLNEYHSDPMEISRTFGLSDITDWWCQQEETHSSYTHLSNVVHDIFSIIPHGVGVVDSYSLGRDVFGCRQSKPRARPFPK